MDLGAIHLTHWGRMTYICIGNLTIIGSDNGLSPARRQAIIWTNAGLLFIGPLGTNFSEIVVEIITFSFTKMHLKMSSGKWRPSCLGLNVLNHRCPISQAYDVTLMILVIRDQIKIWIIVDFRSRSLSLLELIFFLFLNVCLLRCPVRHHEESYAFQWLAPHNVSVPFLTGPLLLFMDAWS